MNGNQLVKKFIDELSKVQNINITPSNISRMRKVFQLSGRINSIIYIKSIAKYPYYWGITKNTVDKIIEQNIPWSIILLFKTQQTGFFISSNEYFDRVNKSLWPFHQGDYKITEGKSLVGLPKFSTIDELVNLLLNQSSELLIDDLIQKAIQETEVNRIIFKNTKSGESISHKNLKEYVASQPELLGLPKDSLSFIEYPFPSGDKVDVAFNFNDNKWIVVEIELEGEIQNFIGLFQVIKYQALLQAVLKTQKLKGEVAGYLIANSIPEKIKNLANILNIKTKEISI